MRTILREERALRAVLVALGGPQIALAAWAAAAPGAFHRGIADHGAFNAHYVADYVAVSAAVGLVLLVSVRRSAWRAGALATSAVWSGLHAMNHVADLSSAASPAIGIGTLAALVVSAMASAALVVPASRTA